MHKLWLLIISLYFVKGLIAQVPVAYLKKNIVIIDSVFLKKADSLFIEQKKEKALSYYLYSVLEISCPLHRSDSNIFNVNYSYFRYAKEDDSLYYWHENFNWNISENMILPQREDDIGVYVIKTGIKSNQRFWVANNYLKGVLVEKFKSMFYDSGSVGVQWWLRREVIIGPQSNEHIAIRTQLGDFTKEDKKHLKNWEQILSYWQ